jgi:hypothetical protein
VLGNGDVVALWQDDRSSGPGTSSSRIFGQLFDTQGAKLGDQFTVAEGQAGGQAGVTLAGVVALDGNKFVVNFVDTSPTQFSGGTPVYKVYGLASTPPAVVITSAGGLTNQAAQPVTGTIDLADAGQVVSIYDGSALVGEVTTGADGSWSKQITLTNEGGNVITARAVSADGTPGTSAPVTYTLDTTAPAVAITSMGSVTADAAHTITGTIDAADAGLTVSIYDGDTLLGTVAPAADGSWSTQVTLPSLGVQTLTAQATDAAGNTGTGAPVAFLLAVSLDGPVFALDMAELAAAAPLLAKVTTPYTVVLADSQANIAANSGLVASLIASGHAVSVSHFAIVGQGYSAYEDDYQGSTYTGSRYFFTNVSDQLYTGYESDVDANGHLFRQIFTGVTGQAYSSYEYDYASNGALEGSRYFAKNVMGQPYTGYEVDVDPQNRVTRYLFTGVSGQGYSAFEYDYAAGAYTGSKYFFTNVAGHAYNGYEIDFDAANLVSRYVFTGVQGQAYSSYEYDYRAGAFTGAKYFFTNVTGQPYTGYEVDLDALNRVTKYAFTGVTGQAYASFEYDYAGGLPVGSKYFFTGVTGQPYTGYELDIDGSGQLAKYAFTGVSGQAYTAYEYDYANGAFAGSRYFFTDVVGQAYTGYEVDFDAANQLTRQAFTGVEGQPYSAYEYDYVGGSLVGSKYQFTGITGQAYSSYEVDLDAAGMLALQVLNNNDGSHRIQGFQDHLTIGAILDDTITGGGADETFVFKPGFAKDTVTDFATRLAGTGHDTIQFAISQFADANAMIAHAADVGGNAVITAANGDQLTLLGVGVPQLQANPGDFKFA